jgi:hypothetical protein
MFDIKRIQLGALERMDKWCNLYWLEHYPDLSLAMRKSSTDNMWYITRRYMPEEVVLYGPYPSKEAIEMLLIVGAIDLTI